jgi:hypothetical protein
MSQENENAPDDEARRMGWVPQDEFRGDDAKWVDAEKFLERGKNELPIMRERMSKQDKQIQVQGQTIKELKGELKESIRVHGEISKASYDRAMSDIKSQQREAVEDGDTKKFDHLEKQKEAIEKTQPKEVKVAEFKEVDNDADFIKWKADNDWYEKDPELKNYADNISAFVAATKPHLVGNPAFFDEVQGEVEKRFPSKFNNSRRDNPPAVEGATRSSPKGSKMTYNDLPQEAKQICDRQVKKGLFKSKDDYVKEYEIGVKKYG